LRNYLIRSSPRTGGSFLWSLLGLSWRGVAALLVEFADALEKTAAVCNDQFGTKDGRTFEVEDVGTSWTGGIPVVGLEFIRVNKSCH
jgi:hypothetical protein